MSKPKLSEFEYSVYQALIEQLEGQIHVGIDLNTMEIVAVNTRADKLREEKDRLEKELTDLLYKSQEEVRRLEQENYRLKVELESS